MLPILLLIFKFSPSRGVVLSIMAIIGSTFVQTCMNFKASHSSDQSRPLVYWEAVAVFLPIELMGTLFGKILVGIMMYDISIA